MCENLEICRIALSDHAHASIDGERVSTHPLIDWQVAELDWLIELHRLLHQA